MSASIEELRLLLIRARDALRAMPPPLSDVYTNNLEPDLNRAIDTFGPVPFLQITVWHADDAAAVSAGVEWADDHFTPGACRNALRMIGVALSNQCVLHSTEFLSLLTPLERDQLRRRLEEFK